jgi:hypothetical protein
MNNQFTRALLASGVTTALALASSNALAVVYPDFEVDATAYGGSEFTADKIVGGYVEVITFGEGTFDVSIKWEASGFYANEGEDLVNQTGLANDYGLYALFQGSGTFVTVGDETQFTLTSGGLDMYLDQFNPETDFTAPATGNLAWTTAGAGDDVLIATGSVISGAGRVECINQNENCGSFGQTTTFELTPTGSNFFTAPIPFYTVSFQSGQFNGFVVGGTVVINGSMDAWFGQVPEPGALALMGMGMVVLGFSVRRKRAQ